MRMFTRELYDQLEEDEDSLYITRLIPKGNGRGHRRIDEPATELMQRQKLALRVLNQHARLLLHVRACGCIPRLDVRQRVLEHVGWKWSLTTDIKDFYPSVTYEMLAAIPELRAYLDLEDIRCCCRTINGRLVLPQGAPTSPMLSNISLTRFDGEMVALVEAWGRSIIDDDWQSLTSILDDSSGGALYSRYMDDILVSIDSPNKNDAEMLREAVLSLISSHGFVPNRRKTKLKPYSQKQKWIGFSLVDRDPVRLQPHVDKNYVNAVIQEGIAMLTNGHNPYENESWNGKSEYIRYNNIARWLRVKRKMATVMYRRGMEIPDYLRGLGVVARESGQVVSQGESRPNIPYSNIWFTTDGHTGVGGT